MEQGMNHLIYSSLKFWGNFLLSAFYVQLREMKQHSEDHKLVKRRTRTESQLYLIALPMFYYLPTPYVACFYVYLL